MHSRLEIIVDFRLQAVLESIELILESRLEAILEFRSENIMKFPIEARLEAILETRDDSAWSQVYKRLFWNSMNSRGYS